MAYDGTLKFDTSMDTSGFQKGLSELSSLVKSENVFAFIQKGLSLVAGEMDNTIARYDALNKLPQILREIGEESSNVSQEVGKYAEMLAKGIAEGTSFEGSQKNIEGTLNQVVEGFKATGTALSTVVDTVAAGAENLISTVQNVLDTYKTWKENLELLKPALENVKNIQVEAEVQGKTLAEVLAQNIEETKESSLADLEHAASIAKKKAEEQNLIAVQAEATAAEAKQTAEKKLAILESSKSEAQKIAEAEATKASEEAAKAMAEADKLSTQATKANEEAIKAGTIASKAGSTEAEKAAATTLKEEAARRKAKSAVAAETAEKQKAKAESALANLESKKTAEYKLLETEATELTTVAEEASTTAQMAKTEAQTLDTIATGASTTAEAVKAAELTVGGAIIGFFTKQVSFQTLATTLCTAATTALTVAVNLLMGPLGILLALIAAAVAIFAIFKLSQKEESEASKENTERMKEYSEEVNKLNENLDESSKSYEKNKNAASGNAKVSQDLFKSIEELANKEGRTAEETVALEAKISDLNKEQEGLGLSFDKTTGKLNMTSKEVEAYMDVSEKAGKQTAIETHMDDLRGQLSESEAALVGVENEMKNYEKQLEKGDISEKEYAKHKKESEKTLKELQDAHEEISGKIDTLEEDRVKSLEEKMQSEANLRKEQEGRIREFAEEYHVSYEDIIADMEKEGLTFDEWSAKNSDKLKDNKDSIEKYAAAWGVSTEQIMQECAEQGISVSQWNDNMQSSWEDYASTVKTKTSDVINGFKKIPTEYSMTGQEMLDNLTSNKEQYARWEENMEQITKELGPTAAEEFRRLGPEANSAMEDILQTPGMLDDYREKLGVKIDEATGVAVENWQDPEFIGAPANATDQAAQQLQENQALPIAATEKIEETQENMKVLATSEEMKGVGTQMGQTVIDGFASLDFTGISEGLKNGILSGMTSIAEGIQTIGSTVTEQVQGMTLAVSSQVQVMSGAVILLMNGMMAGIQTEVSTKSATIQASFTMMNAEIQKVIAQMGNKTKTTAIDMMNSILLAVTSKSPAITSAFTSMKDRNVNIINEMKQQSAKIATDMMTSIASAISDGTSSVEAKSKNAASSITGAFSDLDTKMKTIGEQAMDGIYKGMQSKEAGLYDKANAIASKIASTMAEALDVHSPSRVMERIFNFVMDGVYNPMEENEDRLFKKAEELADGLAERLEIEPNMVTNFTGKLKAAVDTGALSFHGNYDKVRNESANIVNNYTYQMEQTNVSPKALNESTITRNTNDMFRRATRWQLA